MLNIDKPGGMTSHDVVGRVRRIARQRRVGHAGTLDPDATGVLLICLGHATRLADLLAEQGKTYRATLALGVTTSTEDSSGEILSETDASQITHPMLAEILPRFLGDILQTPPMVSAVHHEGRRLYELAREGKIVERPPRSITVDEITLESFTADVHSRAVLTVRCGKGTYVRTLCADLGKTLGVGGHMASLIRLSVGSFDINHATPLDLLTEENIAGHLLSPSQALSFLPARIVLPAEVSDLRNGKVLPLTTPLAFGALVRLIDDQDSLLALGRVTAAGLIHPEKVFPPEQD
ncbi:MAG TPA: tRNA pseudouridine(55) synthase TruB [Capsulimonadaceae bacterium]|nr:tRNA pseudouridine(55) synthase TruB [Capsulimonadaceae bacterium]